MIFWRILDNTLYPVKETNELGFEESEGLRIPDEYLNKKEFIVLRTTWGIGDWGIISAMPRLLKEKYPDCKVYIPSSLWVKKIFGVDTNLMYDIFKNNPYVDDFKDSIEGEIFHDHYRIYNKDNKNIPLVEQILKFWQFKEKEYEDSQPELYWTSKEIELGNKIIKKYVGDQDFGCLLISERFGTQRGQPDEKTLQRETKVLTKALSNNNLPYFYWSCKPLRTTPFNFINKILNLRHISLRVQLYIKSRAKVNISNQCGTNHLVIRYSKIYESQRQSSLGMNFIKEINYI
jgi:hypothetical protein